MATSFTTHSAGQVITSAAINLIQTAVNALENSPAAAGSTTALATGFGVMHRSAATGTGATATGRLNLVGFVAGSSFTCANITTYISSGNGSATVYKYGIYTLDASGNGTLVASTANSTATANSSGKATIALSSPYALVAGTKYAVAEVHVTGSGPTYNTATAAGGSGAMNLGGTQPFAAALLAAQTDLPASFTIGSLSVSTPIYFELTT